jgi:hypothetical protein
VCLGLAHAWSRLGRSVLLVDLDPADELARTLLIGSALTMNTGHTVLDAARGRGLAEPSGSLLPGVDVVMSGSSNAGELEPLIHLLGPRPRLLRDTLGAVRARYDRVLIDCPPGSDALRNAADTAADGWLTVLPCAAIRTVAEAEAWAGALPPRQLGVILNRFHPGAPPEPGAFDALAGAGALATVLPEVPALHIPWDVVAGHGGRQVDLAFATLAAELDDRVAAPGRSAA